MPQRLIFSMCNQDRRGTKRTYCLAALNMEDLSLKWLRAGTTRRDFGVTGIAEDEQGFYAAIQARESPVRIIHFDRRTLRINSEFSLRHASDLHSLCIHEGELLIASTGDNAIYRLVRQGGKIVGEELFWRYPGTSERENDVHLNCLASHGGSLFATAFGPRDENGKFASAGELRNVTSGQSCLAGLTQPHTILFHNGRVYCASSATSEVVSAPLENGNGEIAIGPEKRLRLRGYTRGLAGWGKNILVGISAHRTRSRSQGHQLDASGDHYDKSEIVSLDPETGTTSPVLETTAYGREIYEMIAMDVTADQAFPAPLPFQRLESLRNRLRGFFNR